MRRTFEQTKESLEFMEQVDSLTQEQRDHMRGVVKGIMQCYLDNKCHALLVVGRDDSDEAALMTINCNDFEAALILSRLSGLFTTMNIDDAPPKEMMN